MFTGWFIIVFITSRINKFHWEVWMEICPFDENYCTLSSELSHTDHCARPLEWKRPSQSRTALHCADLLKMQTSWEELQIQRFQPKISGQQIVECCKGCRNATWYKQICQSQNGKKNTTCYIVKWCRPFMQRSHCFSVAWDRLLCCLLASNQWSKEHQRESSMPVRVRGGESNGERKLVKIGPPT